MVERVKALIVDTIKANGQREITGDILQDVLLEMLTSFGEAINEGGADSHWHDNKAVLDLFRFDNDGNVYIDRNFYSQQGVSALGLGDDGDGGDGGGVDMLDSWANYTEAKANYYAPASLLVPFRDDTLSRLASLEAGGGAIDIEIVVTGTGNAVTGVSKSGNTLTFAKGSSFSLSTHNHDTLYKPIGYVPSWGDITGKPTTLSGYEITDAVTTNTAQTITGAKTFSTLLTASAGVNTPKVIFAAAGWSLEQVGTELQMKHNGVVKQRMLSDGTILATSGITALSTE